MKGQTWEGGIRVPLLARWPGRIPAGHVSPEPANLCDLFPTVLAAADVPPPKDRPLDGKNILPLLTSSARSPHAALFAFRGDRLCTVRSGKWKLHLAAPGPAKERVWKPDEKWIDPRRPDGVRILAPYEQAHPSQFPGALTGDAVTTVGLFDLEQDPAEQHNVADRYSDVVKQLQAHAEKLQDEMRKSKP
jgi:arylsulfatase A-like enzyme